MLDAEGAIGFGAQGESVTESSSRSEAEAEVDGQEAQEEYREPAFPTVTGTLLLQSLKNQMPPTKTQCPVAQ